MAANLTATATYGRQRNVVAVIGTTGVGKSQLAVDLARHLKLKSNKTAAINDALILSSDSMQLYEGLPLITNKVTDAEMGGVEHWGIDVVRPGQGGSWEVGKWCQEALQKVRSSVFVKSVWRPLSNMPISSLVV